MATRFSNNDSLSPQPTTASASDRQRLSIFPDKFSLMLRVSEDVSVQLMNPYRTTAVYKVRTTRPDRFVVRPRQGFLKPQSSEVISISLNKGVTSAGDDQFQVEYRLTEPHEDPPSDPTRAGEFLYTVIRGGERIRPQIQKKILLCTVAELTASGTEVSVSPEAHRRGSSAATQASQLYSSARPSAQQNGMDTPMPLLQQQQQPQSQMQQQSNQETQLHALEAELEELEVSVANSRQRIAEEKQSYSRLRAQKEALSAVCVQDEMKIAALQRQNRVASNAPKTVRVHIVFVLVLALAVSTWARWFL